MPRSTFARAVVLGLAYALMAAPITIATLSVCGLEEIALRPFILFKATYAGLLAVAVAPIVALCALGDSEPAS